MDRRDANPRLARWDSLLRMKEPCWIGFELLTTGPKGGSRIGRSPSRPEPRIGLAAVPEPVATIPIAGSGFTIPWVSIVQAAALSATMLLMSKIGRGKYEIHGEPLEYTFKEVKAVAIANGTLVNEERELVIENQFIQVQADAELVAQNVLDRVQLQANGRVATARMSAGARRG